MKRILICSVLLWQITVAVQAEQLLSAEQTEALILQLTDQPRQCWLPQGKIKARHMEYHAFDNSVKETVETVYRDGVRYRLEMRLEDGMSVADGSESQAQTQFTQDFRLNRDRIFIWDGQTYIQYYRSADYAVVVSDSDRSQHPLCGPATAGIIPWGNGDYSFLVLMSQRPTCRTIYTNEQELVMLEYTNDTIAIETTVSFVLDPARDYAVRSFTIENALALLRQTYEDYVSAGNRWVPSKVLIERFDKRSGSPQLISYEDWQFEAVDPAMPDEDRFSLSFENGTMVELQAGDGLKTFLYNASDRVDISRLLEDKIALLQSPDPDAVNCATAAVQHVAKRFAKNIPQTNLTELVSQETKKTALSDMKQTFEQAGLTCMAVETDLETLQKIPDCSKVLYLGISDHYVILDHIEPDAIWIIDLTDRKFYARRDLDEFLAEWNSGVALLISNEPITPPLDANFRYLDADETARIFGGGSIGKYSCTDLIQENIDVTCPEPIGQILCCGAYYEFSERYGCIEDENGGICKGEKYISYKYSACINNPEIQSSCLARDETITRYIRACK